MFAKWNAMRFFFVAGNGFSWNMMNILFRPEKKNYNFWDVYNRDGFVRFSCHLHRLTKWKYTWDFIFRAVLFFCIKLVRSQWKRYNFLDFFPYFAAEQSENELIFNEKRENMSITWRKKKFNKQSWIQALKYTNWASRLKSSHYDCHDDWR